jgi:hypothetical protein
MNEYIYIFIYENTTYNTAYLISSYPSGNVSHKTNTNMADVVFSETTHIITQAIDPNRTYGLDMGVLTCLRWGSRNEI